MVLICLVIIIIFPIALQIIRVCFKLPKLTRIIVVWSDKTITPPLKKWEELGPHSVPVHFKVQERNSIMNKLRPFPEIDTPGNMCVTEVRTKLLPLVFITLFTCVHSACILANSSINRQSHGVTYQD